MSKKLLGRLILSLVAVLTSVSPYVADWNDTHIYNTYWPPHARFHNAQTMVFGALAGLLSLAFLWRPKAERIHLQVGALFAAIYWVTQMPAILFPGTAFTDPQFNGYSPIAVLGYPITQVHFALVLLAAVFGGYRLATHPSVPVEARTRP
ncbi:MAG TPA: DUF6640 family protein [Archangium sp.]|nr:DUF6640 family protein [Archangium sp.]